MTDRPVIEGISLKVSEEAHGIVRQHIEDMAAEAFRNRYGRNHESLNWYYEGATNWSDPDTGEVIEVPPQWMVLVEGVRP